MRLSYLNFCLVIFLLLQNLHQAAYAQDGEMVRDSTSEFLLGTNPADIIASVPPSIDFGFAEIASIDPGAYISHWNNVVYGPDGKYYFAIGDHNPEGTVLLISYDPETKKQEVCINSDDYPDLADGKWHGRPDINPETGDIYLIGFYQGQIVHYNIYDQEVEILQTVGEGFSGIEEHTWDWERNRLYGVSPGGKVLVYDTENQSTISFDEPGENLFWTTRGRLLDRTTGTLYGTEGSDFKFLKYDFLAEEFTIMQSKLQLDLRAWTNTREDDGFFWVFDRTGNVFKFWPEKDSLLNIGSNLETPEYVTFIERSPNGKYLYYLSAQGETGKVIQYNTENGKRKMLANLDDYYDDQYGYQPFSCFGGALNKHGTSIMVVTNGFLTQGQNRPALFNIHIPAEERTLEPEVPEEPTLDMQVLREPTAFVYPNPVSSQCFIQITTPATDQYEVIIQDLTGRNVSNIYKGELKKGEHQLLWDRSASTHPISAGIYYYKVLSGHQTVTGGIVVK